MNGIACDHGQEGCITCGDVALPLTVVSVDVSRRLAVCEADDGSREEVDVSLVDGSLRTGDAVLVHAGVALARLEWPDADAPRARSGEGGG